MSYTEYVAGNNEALAKLAEPTEGWLYGFHMEATLNNGKTVAYRTDRLSHDEFIAHSEHVQKIKELVENMLKGDVEDGVLTLGQTIIRGSAIDLFTVKPVGYKPDPEPM